MLVVMHECVNFLYIGLKNSKILYNVDKYVNQLLEVRTMKKLLAVLLVTAVAVCTTCIASFADGKSLQDVINANSGTEQTTGVTQDNTQAAQPTQPTQPAQHEQPTQPAQPDANTGAVTSGTQGNKDGSIEVKENSSDKFIEDLGKVSDLTTPDVAGVKTATTGIRLVAAFIVQVLSYFITAFLAVRVVLDLCYVTIPFTRSFLGNGYQGTPQSAGNMTPGGMGMNRMGGYGGGYGGYNRYGGMGAGMGMGAGIGAGMGTGMGMGMQNTMSNNANNVIGNIQFVSNAALNAAASESAIGPDGKSQSPIKVYFKDMAVTLVVTPILVLLAATGVLTQFGLLLGNYIGAAIEKIGSMI